MAQYNKWMNESIYSAAASISQQELSKNRGAYFGSILGTLNHIMVADIIWLKRFARHPNGFNALDGISARPMPSSLDSILLDDLTALESERQTIDNAIVAFIAELSSDVLASHLSYHDTKGKPYTKSFAHLLLHFFNHQTHHRGQISTLFSQLGIDIGVTDLLVTLPDVATQN